MKLPLSLAAFLLAAWTSVAGAQLPAAVGETPVPSLAPMLKRVTPGRREHRDPRHRRRNRTRC